MRGLILVSAAIATLAALNGCGGSAEEPAFTDLPSCPTTYLFDSRAIPASMRGDATTMVPSTAVSARDCIYGSRFGRFGLLAHKTLSLQAVARWSADFNATHPDVTAPPGVSRSCGSDNGARQMIYFRYADRRVRAVFAATSGCLGLSNGVRATLLTTTVEADLGLHFR